MAVPHALDVPEILPVLPLKETVVFPGSRSPLAIGQERSVRLIDDVVAGDRMLALVTVKDTSVDTPGWEDVYRIGTVAQIHKMIKVPDGTLRILVDGVQRIRLLNAVESEPYLVGHFEPRSEEHTSELQSRQYLVCRLLLEKKKNIISKIHAVDKPDVQKHDDRTLHQQVHAEHDHGPVTAVPNVHQPIPA